jgi:interferon-induced GTP-binding protein Mx1
VKLVTVEPMPLEGTRSSAIDAALQRNIRPWIDLIDQLRVFGIEKDVPIPQIAVMGDQSSGKSSVLEAISGIPFPRGSGLVTRCATQLAMKRTAPGSSWNASAKVSWGKPQPDVAGAVSSAEQVEEKIRLLTDALTENENGEFSTESIIIEISSPDVPDLTLIDLPGIVRTTTAGQQDKSVIG